MTPHWSRTTASHALVSKGSTSGTTPHGKNESIARAGIESKHEWHDTARQKRENLLQKLLGVFGAIQHYAFSELEH